jgi:type I restriction enzyme M protein
MNGGPLDNLEKLESDLWQAADQLRANSNLASSDYHMPVLGVIFLRHATNRYNAARRQIEEDQASTKMPKRALVRADFLKRRALMLPQRSAVRRVTAVAEGRGAWQSVVGAMNAIEAEFDPDPGRSRDICARQHLSAFAHPAIYCGSS